MTENFDTEGKLINQSKRNFQIIENPDLFISGVSGAGKDTISNFLKEYYGYNKLRLAETIKRIVTELNGISFEELEERKRNEPELRKAHTDWGDKLGKIANTNRLQLICDRKSMDFATIEETKPLIICDVRGYDEAILSSINGLTGLFLTRSNKKEFSGSHWTDYGFFRQVNLPEDVQDRFKLPKAECILFNELVAECKKLSVNYNFFIINNGNIDLSEITITDNVTIINFDTENVTEEMLLEVVDTQVFSQILIQEEDGTEEVSNN